MDPRHFSIWIMFSRVCEVNTIEQQHLILSHHRKEQSKSTYRRNHNFITLGRPEECFFNHFLKKQITQSTEVELKWAFYVYMKWCCQNVLPIYSIIFFDPLFSISIQWLPQSCFLVRWDKRLKQHLDHRIPSLNCIVSSLQWGVCLSLQTKQICVDQWNELLLCLKIMTIIFVVQDWTPMASIKLSVTWDVVLGLLCTWFSIPGRS